MTHLAPDMGSRPPTTCTYLHCTLENTSVQVQLSKYTLLVNASLTNVLSEVP